MKEKKQFMWFEKKFQAPNYPYQIKQTESKSVKRWGRRSIFGYFWITINKWSKMSKFCVEAWRTKLSSTR